MDKITRTDEEQKKAAEIFDCLRAELLRRDLSNTENYDKSILTLSAASLGLSLTAIRFIVPIETASYLWLLILGWILLLISIVSSLSAYLISNKAIAGQIKNAEDYYLNCQQDAFNKKNIYTNINVVINYTTGITFSIAIISIVLFVILNINPGESNMAKKTNQKTTTSVVKKSANIPPNMQRVPSGNGSQTNSANVPSMQQAPGTSTTSQGGNNGGNSGNGSGGKK